MHKNASCAGVNVVIASLDDDLLAKCHADMEKAFPDLEFRKVGVNLGSGDEKVCVVAGNTMIDHPLTDRHTWSQSLKRPRTLMSL